MPIIGVTHCRKLEDYRQSVLHVGGEVRILEPSADVEAALAGIDGLLLTGGNDVAPTRYGEAPHSTFVEAEPGRDEFEIGLIAAARKRDLPIFAICGRRTWRRVTISRAGWSGRSSGKLCAMRMRW